MSYKIVVDSGCDLPQRLREDEHFVVVPLTLSVGGVDIVDDDSFASRFAITMSPLFSFIYVIPPVP